MVWVHDPSRRNDILLEENTILDGSGAYTSPWVETSGIEMIRVAAMFNGGTPTVKIQEGVYGSGSNDPSGGIVRNQDVVVSGNPGYAELAITARYFRLLITGGTSNGSYRATIRKVS